MAAAAPPAPPRPAAPLGGRDPRPSARPQGRREAARRPGGSLSPRRLGQLRGGRRDRPGRAAGLRARLSPPARGRWQGRPLRGRWAPGRPAVLAALGTGRFLRDSASFSLTEAFALLSPPFLSFSLFTLAAPWGRRRGARRPPWSRCEERAGGCRSRHFSVPARARFSSGALPLLPFGAPRARREALEGRRGYSALSGFDPVSAGTPGWLLAARRAADGLLGLLVLLSLSLPSPVVVCLSTTFRPAHYNAGERRSQDKDLKGWWVEKQGSKGGYALISRIRAVISQDDSEVLLESYFTKLVCIFSCQVPPLPGYFERSRSSARLSRAGPPPRCKMQNDL